MKKLILLNILLSSFASAQNYHDFMYEQVTIIDGFIGKIESYNSKTGIYCRESCHIYAPPLKEQIMISLTEEEKSDLWKTRKKFGNYVFAECSKNKNVAVKSYFYFEKEKYPPRCIENDRQKAQFIELNMTLRQILESKSEYRKVFYWEFINK
ncbi:hypothetical protein MKJ01_11040 [Chryseobacterium sp. SSA4.19]|uniref:hypothetical protein n=1 Tax=Chryseobacterium sp. SSA4.19 TaxID=2919915 RepID=UPI001F4DD416|nr:hypothetical protein [Chryseobacterium sp. SSA4.19]MCJ8154294.1 hypothetical protein [Chryseobacterium sp. SSA4.19]